MPSTAEQADIKPPKVSTDAADLSYAAYTSEAAEPLMAEMGHKRPNTIPRTPYSG